MTALFAMGRSRTPRWADAIAAELDSKDPQLQLEAVNAAAEFGLSSATPKLRNLTVHKDKEIRMAAIWALAHTRGPGALETLEMCAQSDDEEIRNVANDAIEEFYRDEEEDDDESSDDDGKDSEESEQ
jgi:HEAT repeat protein